EVPDLTPVWVDVLVRVVGPVVVPIEVIAPLTNCHQINRHEPPDHRIVIAPLHVSLVRQDQLSTFSTPKLSSFRQLPSLARAKSRFPANVTRAPFELKSATHVSTRSAGQIADGPSIFIDVMKSAIRPNS